MHLDISVFKSDRISVIKSSVSTLRIYRRLRSLSSSLPTCRKISHFDCDHVPIVCNVLCLRTRVVVFVFAWYGLIWTLAQICKSLMKREMAWWVFLGAHIICGKNKLTIKPGGVLYNDPTIIVHFTIDRVLQKPYASRQVCIPPSPMIDKGWLKMF